MPTWYPAKEHFQKLSSLTREPAHWRALVAMGSEPANEFTDFVGSLKTLNGVPFKYLVPDARMLPPESIRFFCFNPNWISALVAGALSIGQITKSDLFHDQAVAEWTAPAASQVSLNLRRKILKQERVPAPEEEPQYAGFLMRSAVVSGWPGLEIVAYESKDATGKTVDPVRIERLSPDVLLCIFKSTFLSVNIHEPKEGVAFGALPIYPPGLAETDGVDPTGYEKSLRGLGVNGYTVGQVIPECKIAVPLRATGTRVVDMTAYRQAMLTKLTSLQPPAWNQDQPFTAAQFTLEAVQGASQFIFHAEDGGALDAHDENQALTASPQRSTASQRNEDQQQLNRFLFAE